MTCGIYRIYHKTTGKSYIGQSVNVEGRLWSHFKSLAKGNHHCVHLQRSFDKYGAEAFETQILETCEQSDLTEREQFWMDTAHYMYGIYNIAAVAGSTLGVKLSAETRRKISETKKGKPISDEHRRAISKGLHGNQHTKGFKHSEKSRLKLREAMKNRILSAEHRKRIGEAHVGSKRSKETCANISKALTGKQLSEEHRQKISSAQKGKPKSEETRRRMSEARKLMNERRRMEASHD